MLAEVFIRLHIPEIPIGHLSGDESDISIQKTRFVASGVLVFSFVAAGALENSAIYRTRATWHSKWPLGPARVLLERSKGLFGPASAPLVRSKWPLWPALVPPVSSEWPLWPALVPPVRPKRLFEPAVQDHYSKVLVSVTLCSVLRCSALLAPCMDMHGFTLVYIYIYI